MSGQKCLLLLSNSGQFVTRTVDGSAFKITEKPRRLSPTGRCEGAEKDVKWSQKENSVL